MVDLKKDEQAAFDAVNKAEAWYKAHPVWALAALAAAVLVIGFIVGKLW